MDNNIVECAACECVGVTRLLGIAGVCWMNKILLCFSMLFLVQPAFAKEVYQCNVNGTVTFQAVPCKGTGKTVGDVLKEKREKEDAQRQARERYDKQYAAESAKVESNSTRMNFSDCKKKVLSVQLSVAGTRYKAATIVNTGNTYIARVCTNDGSVLMTCSGIDSKLITTKSSSCPL